MVKDKPPLFLARATGCGFTSTVAATLSAISAATAEAVL